MKKLRTLSLLLAALFLLLPLSSCGKKGATLDDLKPTDELVIYIPQQRNTAMYLTEEYIMPYRVLYPDVNVRIVQIPGDEDGSWKDYSDRVTKDLLVGEGPDVLFLEYLPSLDVGKAARNHNFFDLTDLLASDPDFREEDYLDGVLDAVKIDGRIYTLPRSFHAPVYLSDREKLEELGFDWSGMKKTSDFMEELARLTPIAAQDDAFEQMLESKNRFSELFDVSGVRLLDYDRQIVLPDEAEFRAFMESYKTFFPYDYDELDSGWANNYRVEELTRGEFVFWRARHFYSLNWNMRDMADAGHGCTLGVLPAQSGEIVGLIDTQLAVSAASKNVLNAYNFIKMMCSEEIMAMRFWDNHKPPTSVGVMVPLHSSAPVLKNVIGMAVRGEGPLPLNYHLTDEEADEIIRQYTEIDRFTVKLNSIVYDMLWDAMLPYLQDKASYDDCLAELQRKLNFYLSE